MVTLDNLSDEIYKIVNEYSDDVKKQLELNLDKTAKQIIDYIKLNAPRSGRRGALADSFITLATGSGINKIITIYSKEKGRIVHLLEFGYKHKSGKYISPRPFMRPGFDKFSAYMLEDIKRIIENGG